MIDFALHSSVSFILFLVFGAVASLKNGQYDILKITGLVMAIGLFKELYDLMDYGFFSLSDLEHDFVGIAIGYILIVTLSKRHKV
jgi:hypothetical protein